MSVECKCSQYFADILESFLCQSYIKQGSFIIGDVCPGTPVRGWGFVLCTGTRGR